jgi:hypothetical protein
LVDTQVLVIGIVSGGTFGLRVDRQNVETEYLLSVIDAIRGDAAGQLRLRVPGGRLVAADGTVVDVRTPGFSLEAGRTYLLCLKPAAEPVNDAEGHVVVLSEGPQGVIDISDNTVKMMKPLNQRIRGQYENGSVDRFLRDVRTFAKAADTGNR